MVHGCGKYGHIRKAYPKVKNIQLYYMYNVWTCFHVNFIKILSLKFMCLSRNESNILKFNKIIFSLAC